MKRLIVYLKEYRKESVIAPLFKMLEAFFDLLVPVVVARIIDRGIASGDMNYVIRLVLILVGLAVVGLSCSLIAQYFSAKASVGFATRIRQALFDHIQQFSYSELDVLGANTLITRMTSDINQMQNGVNMGLRLLLRSPCIVFGAMIMAFTIDVRCALIFVVAIPALAVVVFGIMFSSIPKFRRVQAALDKVLGITRENLTGVRVIRAFCKEEDEIREFNEQNAFLTKLNLRVGSISALMNPVTYAMINIATIVLIQQGAVRVNLGILTQGDVVALYNYMAQILVELIKFASLIITINKAIACADRVADVMSIEPGMEFSEQAGESEGADGAVKSEASVSAVTFENASLTYKGAGAPSIENISFEAGRGETIGIIGGTGSGKSSLVNLIPRFYDATQGRVLVDGMDVKEYAEGVLGRKIGVVPQRAMLFAGSIRDNLLFGNENATDEELWEAIEAAQAGDVVRGKEGGLSYELEQGGRNLSGGQKQRLTIARALVTKPQILILDDSASALDFATDAALRKAIRKLTETGKMTVFIVSQRTSSIREADQILVLEDGQLVGHGTHDALMKQCEAYQEIYYSQFPEERPAAGKKRTGDSAGKVVMA